MTVTEAKPTKSELTCPEDLVSKIQPYLGPALVREFGCIYKFVVVDDNGAAIYHLDLKHGLHCMFTAYWSCDPVHSGIEMHMLSIYNKRTVALTTGRGLDGRTVARGRHRQQAASCGPK